MLKSQRQINTERKQQRERRIAEAKAAINLMRKKDKCMKKIIDLRKWPKSVPQPSMEEVLKRKKEKREEKIRNTKRKIDKIRNKS